MQIHTRPITTAAMKYSRRICLIGGLILGVPSDAIGWQDLWRTPNQQAAELLEQQQAAQAAELFEQADWRGVANYRAGNFAQALADFKQQSDANGFYNQGNALAQLGDYQAAIAAYERAIELDPRHQDAIFNRDLLQKMLEQSAEDEREDDPKAKDESPPEDQQPENQPQSDQTGEQNQDQSVSGGGADTKPSNQDEQTDQNNQKDQPKDQKGDGKESDQTDQPQQGHEPGTQPQESADDEGHETEQEQPKQADESASQQAKPNDEVGEQFEQEPSAGADQTPQSEDLESSPEQESTGAPTQPAALEQSSSQQPTTEPKAPLADESSNESMTQHDETQDDIQQQVPQPVPTSGDEQQTDDSAIEQELSAPPANDETTESPSTPDLETTADRERQQSSELWLNRVPDDPGGLLRQKFLRDHLRKQQP